MRRFQTSTYSGAWIRREADRNTTRVRIEAFLREALCDPDGRLVVDATGPHWVGTSTIGLSYAHDEDTVFLAWTPEGRPVGVDLEPAQRRPRHSVTALSSRFFHASESQALSEIPEPDRSDVFLELWLKKEALAKLTRKGLVHTLPLRLDAIQDVEFEAPALLPDGKRAVLAFFRDSFPGA